MPSVDPFKDKAGIPPARVYPKLRLRELLTVNLGLGCVEPPFRPRNRHITLKAFFFTCVFAVPVTFLSLGPVHAEDLYLHHLLSWGQVDKAIELIRGGRVNIHATDRVGITALHVAARNGHDSVVSVLIEHGAEIDARANSGDTPLHHAAYGGSAPALYTLLEAGADPHARGSRGNTLMHFAVAGRIGNRNIACLIEAGANVTVPNDMGLTPEAMFELRFGVSREEDELFWSCTTESESTLEKIRSLLRGERKTSSRTVAITSAEDRKSREEAQRRELMDLQAAHKAKALALQREHHAALAKARDGHRAALESLKVQYDSYRERLEAEHEKQVAVTAARHSERLASLEIELKAEADRRRLDISEAEDLIRLTDEASRKLVDLHAGEAEMLAVYEQVFETRRVALKELFERLSAVTKLDDYLLLLKTAEETQLDWARMAILRYGLGSNDFDLPTAAWRHLLKIRLKDRPELRNLLTDHLVNVKTDSQLRNLLAGHLVNLENDSEVRSLLADHLPTVRQWASRVVDATSSYGPDYSPEWALGEPTPRTSKTRRCRRVSDRTHWAPSTRAGAIQSIRVAFEGSVILPTIEIYESSTPGFVRKLILSDGNGNDSEYGVQDKLNMCPGVSVFRMHEHTSPVSELAVVVDTHHERRYRTYIDAIAIIGVPVD